MLAASDFGDITQIIVYLVLAAASVIGSILSQKKQQDDKSQPPRVPPKKPSVARQPQEIRTRSTDLPHSVPTQPERSAHARPLRREPARAAVPGVPTTVAEPQVRRRVQTGRLVGRIAQREPLASRLTLTIHTRPGIQRRIASRAAPGHLHDPGEPRPAHHVHVSPETGRQRRRTQARAGEVILELTRSPASLRSAIVLAELLAAPRAVEENPRF